MCDISYHTRHSDRVIGTRHPDRLQGAEPFPRVKIIIR
jgi:hypothetical protein